MDDDYVEGGSLFIYDNGLPFFIDLYFSDSEPEREIIRQLLDRSKTPDSRHGRARRSIDSSPSVSPMATRDNFSKKQHTNASSGSTTGHADLLAMPCSPSSPSSSDVWEVPRPSHDTPKPLDLTRFSYVSSRHSSLSFDTASSGSRPFSRLSGATALTDPDEVVHVAVAKRKKTSAAASVWDHLLPPRELSRVLKCPSCLLSWTVLKTNPMKIQHIRTCAKKSGMPVEVVRTVMEQDLLSVPASGPSKKVESKKPTSKKTLQQTIVHIPDSTQTFLNDVVDEAAPKKRSRHKTQAPISVKPVSQALDAISNRAKSLFDDDRLSSSSSSSFTGAGMKGIDTQSGENSYPPATQPFSNSRIAESYYRPLRFLTFSAEWPASPRARHGVSTFFQEPSPNSSPVTSPSVNMPAHVSQFGSPHVLIHDRLQPVTFFGTPSPSSASGPSAQTREMDIPPSDGESIVFLRTTCRPSSPSKDPESSIEVEEILDGSPSLELDPNQPGEWSDEDNAIIAWDGSANDVSAVLPTKRRKSKSSINSLDRPVIELSDSSSEKPLSATLSAISKKRKGKARRTSPSPSPTPKSPSISKKRGRKPAVPKTPARQKNAISDEALYLQLEGMIMNDRELRCRILRFEVSRPLHVLRVLPTHDRTPRSPSIMISLKPRQLSSIYRAQTQVSRSNCEISWML